MSLNTLKLEKYEKCFLFHLKGFFLSPDIHTFVFPSSPLFPFGSFCFRGYIQDNS